MKTVFFCVSISIFFEIVLTVVCEKRRIYFEKYRNRYSDLSRTDAPYQGKDKSNGNIPFYDKELIELVSQECNIPAKELEKVDEKRANQWHLPLKEAMQMEPQYHFRPMNDVLFDAQSTVIRDLAEKEDCIIVGRCADYVLQEKKNCHRVFIYAPFDYRVQTVIHRLDRNETSAKRLVKKMDKERRYYYEYFTDRKWMDMNHYDLCIDSSKFSETAILDILETLYLK